MEYFYQVGAFEKVFHLAPFSSEKSVSASTVTAMIFLAGLVTPSAHGQSLVEVNVDGQSINLVIPEGYCRLSDSNPEDKSLLDPFRQRLSNTSRILLAYARCASPESPAEERMSGLNMLGMYSIPFHRKNYLALSLEFQRRDLPEFEAALRKRGLADYPADANADTPAEYILGREEFAVYMGTTRKAWDGRRGTWGVAGFTWTRGYFMQHFTLTISSTNRIPQMRRQQEEIMKSLRDANE